MTPNNAAEAFYNPPARNQYRHKAPHLLRRQEQPRFDRHRAQCLRRSPRYSPYRAGDSYSSSNKAYGFLALALTSTPSRLPRSPAPPRRPQALPVKTGRPRDDIWQHYSIERENGKKHGCCKYCGFIKKNGKPTGHLLNHLTKPKQCPNVPRDVMVSLRPTAIVITYFLRCLPPTKKVLAEIDRDKLVRQRVPFSKVPTPTPKPLSRPATPCPPASLPSTRPVRLSRRRRSLPSSSSQMLDEEGDLTGYHVCKACGKRRKHAPNNGYTNLVTHVRTLSNYSQTKFVGNYFTLT
ncbi:Zinc finger, BED-type [Phytophthora cactorum]|nr:Zinc finger, BED-type [Phytophthora cactorum]